MSKPWWHLEPISKQHKRDEFDCGHAELNQFLQRYARQSHERHTAKTYVALDTASQRIIGFYTVSLTSIQAKKRTTEQIKKYGNHALPCFLLARLAIDKSVQEQGFGGQLLVVAVQRCKAVAEQVGGIGLMIDAKNQAVANWYQSFGAIPLHDEPLALSLPFSQFK